MLLKVDSWFYRTTIWCCWNVSYSYRTFLSVIVCLELKCSWQPLTNSCLYIP